MNEKNLETPLTRLLGIRHPVLSAPMAWVAGGHLASAVSEAGGLGLIGGGYGDAEWLERELASAADTPVGVGFITWSLKQKPDLLDQVLAHQPSAMMLSFGELAGFAQKIRKADCCLLAQVQTVEQAKKAVDEGADVIIAQGTEAGGHGANRATLPLVPAVVDAVGSVPVVAAGGIADGRGAAAAMMLGASGVLMGSRFYATEESLAHPTAKAGAASAVGDDTVRSSVFDRLRGYGWPEPYTSRSLRNRMTDRWHDHLPELEENLTDERERFQAGIEEGDFNLAPLIVGEAVDLIDRVRSARDVVEDVVAEAVELLGQGAPNVSLGSGPA
ncbi:nitronate monooxygenase [Salicola sp. Rm-C-2C1-2]|uniref:NAD(P)H-dependent flavin oxidoreductase n=1 Tax=Salicola sp. Rm-C-2C1-2 TaxID=3141321 RepID=UPI0032E4CF6C